MWRPQCPCRRRGGGQNTVSAAPQSVSSALSIAPQMKQPAALASSNLVRAGNEEALLALVNLDTRPQVAVTDVGGVLAENVVLKSIDEASQEFHSRKLPTLFHAFISSPVPAGAVKRAKQHIMTKGFDSVTNKPVVPPSGDKRDFMTTVVYAWECKHRPADCTAYSGGKDGSKGEPLDEKNLRCETDAWVICDAQFNTKVMEALDFRRLSRVINNVHTLAKAWQASGDREALALAVEQLRVFFVDGKLSVLPRLLYSQVVPNTPDRSTGSLDCVIDWYEVHLLLDAVSVMQPDMHADTVLSLQKWFAEFLKFITKPDVKALHDNHRINHGTWYSVVVMSIAAWLGATQVVKDQAEVAKDQIKRMIAANGDMPGETERVQSIYYFGYTLESFIMIAHLGMGVGVDLWNYIAPNGASIPRALGFAAQHLKTQFMSWPYKNKGAYLLHHYTNSVRIVPVSFLLTSDHPHWMDLAVVHNVSNLDHGWHEQWLKDIDTLHTNTADGIKVQLS